MYCKYCGSLIDKDSTFCSHCGKRQKEDAKEQRMPTKKDEETTETEEKLEETTETTETSEENQPDEATNDSNKPPFCNRLLV